jgi:stearoyl-CoA desaturase (delta-9 desaturase)
MKNKKNIDWTPAIFLTLSPLIGIVLTGVYLYLEGFQLSMLALFVVFYSLTALSITAGYHRLWSHKTYEANLPLQWFLSLFGAAAFQNSIYKWSVDHRLHHRFVDTDKDPYSINKGFFFAHMGWMLVKEDWPAEAKAFSRDLERDPVVMFQHRYYLPLAIGMGFFLPTLIGYFLGSALGGLAVGGFLRISALHHGTFLINSACHWWGSQPYTNDNTARDNLVLAFLTFGEGYHNFHHLFATDYRNGIKWYHWDPTKWLIQINQRLGLAFNLRQTDEKEILKARLLHEKARLESILPKARIDWSKKVETMARNLEIAQTRWVELKSEYKAMKRQKQLANLARRAELKTEVRLAKLQLRASLEQWAQMRTQIRKSVAQAA